MKNIILILLVLTVITHSYYAQQIITIDVNVRYQTLEGFGGSDAWNCEYVGKYWDNSQKESIAKYLFSKAIDSDGNPEGIGLSRWRFNIGAGSEEQKPAGDFDKPERRAECFLNSDGTYNWEKQSGQQWFLRQANYYGVENLIAFVNSPPVFYTKNGLAHGSGSTLSNLSTDKYDDYSGFISEVLHHFSDEGINFDWISPLNEPQYDWSGGQEGCTWTNGEIFKIIKTLDSTITASSLDSKIMITEAGSWEYLYTQKDNASKSKQIDAFFDSTSNYYLGDFENVPNAVCGHTYWSFANNSSLVSVRNKVNHKAKLYDLDLYQTEYSELGDVDESLSSYMDHALFMAKVIYADLTLAHSKAWSYWTVLERERWDQQNRFYLIRIKPSDGDYGDLTKSGVHYASKTLWTLGNFSRFVRPGYQLLKVSGASNLSSLMGSAFIAPDSSKLVLVLMNYEKSAKEIIPNLINLPVGKGYDKLSAYLTDSFNDLKNVGEISKNSIITLPARSVLTLIADLDNSVDTTNRIGSWSLKYVDSEEIIGENAPAINAIDGNENTFWHTQWEGGSPSYPHEIQIDFGSQKEIYGFSYLPRQYNSLNGTIKDFDFYTTNDTTNWGPPIASGSWEANKTKKKVITDKINCRYIRLVAKSEINGKNWASAAEIAVLDSTDITTSVKKENIKSEIKLFQSYPNPFNSQCNIEYSLPKAGLVNLEIYNMLGQKIASLVNKYQTAGDYNFHWNTLSHTNKSISSGVYIYKLRLISNSNTWVQSKKLTYLK